MAEPTKLNVELALLPRVVMAAMQTTTIRANITAYSTAVGPSSFLTKFTRLFVIARIHFSSPGEPGAIVRNRSSLPVCRDSQQKRYRARQHPSITRVGSEQAILQCFLNCFSPFNTRHNY